MHSVCLVVELHVTVNYVIILIVAQQCFYGKVMSLATTQIIHTSFQKKSYSINLHSSHTLHINAALEKEEGKKMIFCLWPSSDIQLG
jgi:hypothetical protein